MQFSTNCLSNPIICMSFSIFKSKVSSGFYNKQNDCKLYNSCLYTFFFLQS